MNFEPIGIIHSGFKEKFGIPRQPGLASSMQASIELLPGYASEEIVRGLEGCSHIWLIFIFSACADKGWTPTVRPPRLGGNRRVGVLATRSPFRPNPIGLSAVKLDGVICSHGKVQLQVSGADLMDQTPILDIKPYLPYSDQIPTAEFSLAESYRALEVPVIFNNEAKQQCDIIKQKTKLPIEQQITEILRCDPRPAYQRSAEREYGIRLHDYNVRWSITDEEAIYVHSIEMTTDVLNN
ncbi:tRNA (N6-threonylcarbamoyladenosine(37)-N6)-methyltransferase TrmO [Neptunomonas japonica]|uniref:tRNA (N6-threonylcarbamoyladenosine(37)-N6)-methyltransferase TrmO n=1 Tax=Neptunomonas japonica TaxID=417574 RepID=UPI00048AAEEF|nr:tRNA (N6-threonylcarbamoyladenosine(37)-N6)-methyltransferase TrmO [Neptunomonas japonica]